MALVHYPVRDKNGATIASAVTNLDVHDIARVCRTYGVDGYYVVTPLADQKILVKRILGHWTDGAGGTYNPDRRRALERVRVCSDIATMVGEIAARHGRRPLTVATSARRQAGCVSHRRLRGMLADTGPLILVFGTAWGLADECLETADLILEPLAADRDYNHLSVRSAAAIILDRLLGG